VVDGGTILIDHPKVAVFRVGDEPFEVPTERIERQLLAQQIDRYFIIVRSILRALDRGVRETRQRHARRALKRNALGEGERASVLRSRSNRMISGANWGRRNGRLMPSGSAFGPRSVCVMNL
jgi:hypothetical protein